MSSQIRVAVSAECGVRFVSVLDGVAAIATFFFLPKRPPPALAGQDPLLPSLTHSLAGPAEQKQGTGEGQSHPCSQPQESFTSH